MGSAHLDDVFNIVGNSLYVACVYDLSRGLAVEVAASGIEPFSEIAIADQWSQGRDSGERMQRRLDAFSIGGRSEHLPGNLDELGESSASVAEEVRNDAGIQSPGCIVTNMVIRRNAMKDGGSGLDVRGPHS